MSLAHRIGSSELNSLDDNGVRQARPGPQDLLPATLPRHAPTDVRITMDLAEAIEHEYVGYVLIPLATD